MLKSEFENLTLKGDESISGLLYDSIERYYTSESDYHKINNPEGLNESKQNFCKRIFGGKYNTPKTILEKITQEAIKENRYCLRNHNKSKTELDHMDILLTEHYEYLSKHNY